jgi:hypothetical protein
METMKDLIKCRAGSSFLVLACLVEYGVHVREVLDISACQRELLRCLVDDNSRHR